MMSCLSKTSICCFKSCSIFFFVLIVDYRRAINFDITFSELKVGRLKAVVCDDEVLNYLLYITIVVNLKYLLQ